MKIELVLVAVALCAAATSPSAQGGRNLQKARPAQMRENTGKEEAEKEPQEPAKPAEPASDSAAEPLDVDALDAASMPAPVELPPVPVFAGTPREALAEIRKLAREGRGAEGAALAQALGERLDDEHMAAELRYAGGVAHSLADLAANAAVDFRAASVLAGPGDLRLDALYNEAVERIVEGEVLRADIMEIAAKDLAKQPTGAPTDVGTKPDTLPAAREKYVEAKGLLIDRVRLDWRDGDLRANLEFVQRRLDELAEIEENRDAAKSQRSSQGKETEKTQEGEGATKGEEESEQEQEEDGKQGNDPESEQESVQDADPKPGEGGKEGDDMPDPKAEEREGEEQQKQEQAETGDLNEETESKEGGAQADPKMSQQEARLILDRLTQIDENAKQLRAAYQRMRMIQVARDW